MSLNIKRRPYADPTTPTPTPTYNSELPYQTPNSSNSSNLEPITLRNILFFFY